jgi:hypothetical protein
MEKLQEKHNDDGTGDRYNRDSIACYGRKEGSLIGKGGESQHERRSPQSTEFPAG